MGLPSHWGWGQRKGSVPHSGQMESADPVVFERQPGIRSQTPLYTTAFYMIADLAEKRAYFANAGHPKPMVICGRSG